MGDIRTVSRGSEVNFSFAFDDLDFSDRILRLEITPDDDCDTDSGKKPTAEKYNDWFSCIQGKDSESSDGAKVTTLHICSLVLAEKSPFFYKLFKNGMRESQQKNEVCLRINASEEATLMDLLRFMYGESALKPTSFYDLADLLIAADKFELPSSVSVSEIVKPLLNAAKQFVAALYTVMKKPSMEFESRLKVDNPTLAIGGWGLPNLLGITWPELMIDDCDHFIDGVLHVKVDLTVKNS